MFIDTNVFLYAAGRSHPMKPYALRVLENIGSGAIEAQTNTEVIQEILYVLNRRNARDSGIALAREVLDLLPNPLPVTKPDTALALLYLERYRQLKVRDAIHLGTMLTNGIEEIVSADRDFDGIDDIRRLDLSEF